MLVVVEQIILT